MTRPLLRLGTRGSPLALIQANLVRDALLAAHPSLRAPVARPDGSEVRTTQRRGSSTDGIAMGRDAGAELKRRAGPGFYVV